VLAWGAAREAVLIVDASSSGAFICTNLFVPRWGLVQVRFRTGTVAGWVVRVATDGIGIEWWQFAPPTVIALPRIEMYLGAKSRASAGLASNAA